MGMGTKLSCFIATEKTTINVIVGMKMTFNLIWLIEETMSGKI